MKKHLLVVAFVIAFVASACTPQTQVTKAAEITHDDVQTFKSNMEGDYLLLDVRTQEEYDQDNIEGATLIPVAELEARLDELAQYKDTPILVYCRSGNRSMTASQILIENGFEDVHNLLGGIGAWNKHNSD